MAVINLPTYAGFAYIFTFVLRTSRHFKTSEKKPNQEY